MAKTFEQLEVWQKARAFAQAIHSILQSAPLSMDFELKNQLNRSSGSIMDNIAEGYERNNNKEFIYFLFVAKGSAGESRSQLFRAFDRNYIDQTTHDNLHTQCLDISQQLSRFIDYLKKSPITGYKHITKTNSE
jgi:four helix bundle protein